MGLRNSLVTFLIEYVDAMFKDIEWAYLHPKEWQRDHSRLISALENHGSRVVTLDLPAVGKHLDKCLDEGLFVPSSIPFTRRKSKEVVLPVFGLDLYRQVFHLDGKLREDARIEVLYVLRSLYIAGKKLRLQYTEKSLDEELTQFKSIEEELIAPSLTWNNDTLAVADHLSDNNRADDHRVQDSQRSCYAAPEVLSCETNLRGLSFGDVPLGFEDASLEREFAQYLHLVCDIVSSSLGDFDSETPTELPKHGPGVTSELKKGMSKYSFDNYPSKLASVFPFDLYGTYDLGYHRILEDARFPNDLEDPSRIIAVPKTMKGPRLIAAEPSYHQWIQQLVWNQLEARLANSPIAEMISFRDQTRNQVLALRGSADGSYATIDLKSASDRLTCWAIERCFRVNPTLLRRVFASRTRRASYKDKFREFTLDLKKFASMGSALTFPVQSVFYSCVAVAVTLFREQRKPTTSRIRSVASRISVFGDDIVVDRRDCRTLCTVLEALGLRVNVSKTFEIGNFRESCGVDGFRGVDITPPYLLNPPTERKSLMSLDSFIEESNNFFKKGFWNVAIWLQNRFHRYHSMIPIIHKDSGFSGLVSFMGNSLSHLKKRWNKALHREEVRCTMAITKVPSLPMPDRHRMFQWSVERPAPDTRWESGIRGQAVSVLRLGWRSVDFMSSWVTPI